MIEIKEGCPAATEKQIKVCQKLGNGKYYMGFNGFVNLDLTSEVWQDVSTQALLIFQNGKISFWELGYTGKKITQKEAIKIIKKKLKLSNFA